MARLLVLGIGLSALAVGAIGCNLAEPPVFDAKLLQQSERALARENVPDYMQPLPTTREAPYVNGPNGQLISPAHSISGRPIGAEPTVQMSLQEIIHRAVVNNHDVRVAGYQPAIEGSRVIEAEAHYDPTYFTNLQFAHTDEMTAGELYDNFNNLSINIFSKNNQSDIYTFQTGIKEYLPSGGQVQLQLQDVYSNYSQPHFAINTFYENDVTLQLTQPLLRNFGQDVNWARIVINRDNQKVSLLDFRKAVESNISDIEKAYWQLVQALRDVKVQEGLLAQTETTYNILYQRMVQNLDVGQLQVSQAQTSLESARATLAEAKGRARDLSDQIKQLMSDPDFPVSSPLMVIPADIPVTDPLHFDLQDQIDTAMENRFELGEQQLKIDVASVTANVAKNNLLPQLNFVGSTGFQGVGANQGDAMNNLDQFNHLDFTAGLQLEIPIGNREARAIWKRSLLQRMQAIEQYRAIIETVSLDVRQTARAVDTTWKLVVANRRARYAAEDALRSINERERANEPLSPVFVQLKLDTQSRLANAEQAENQAIANYNISLALLERAKGTLLRYNNVVLEEKTPSLEENGLLR